MCGCSPSPPPERPTPTPWAAWSTYATFHQELSLHRGYAAEFGLAEADLERAEKSPECAAYTDFLLRTAATAEFAEVLAALLPCMWGYSELGRSMAATGLPTEARYRRWIQTYADPGFAALAAWCASCWTRRPTVCQRPAWPPANARSWPASATNSPSGTLNDATHGEQEALGKLVRRWCA